MNHRRGDEAEEARRNLQRMHEQSEKLITGPRQADDDEDDPVVILGKRIGRTIGYAVAVGLLFYLMATYLGHKP
jgi:tetrahydromethanopterin S-methyltransferase subunit G